MKMKRIARGLHTAVFAFGVVLSLAAAIVHAQGLITTQKLSAPLANELVGTTVATCAAQGHNVTAVVVDLDGVRQAVLRGNGAPIHSLDNAYYKALQRGVAHALAQGRQHQGRSGQDEQECADHGSANAAAQCHVWRGRRDADGRR
jgi:hypothetical protein